MFSPPPKVENPKNRNSNFEIRAIFEFRFSNFEIRWPDGRTRLMMKVGCIALVAWATVSGAYSQSADGRAAVVWVAMEGRTQLKKTAPGTTLEGKLARSVYWRDTEVFSKGSTVVLVVDQIELQKKAYAVDDRPFVIHLFAPRHDVVARFRSVKVLMAGGVQVPLRSTFIALTQRAELRAETEKPAAKGGQAAADASGPAPKLKQQKPVSPWVLTLQVEPEGTTFAALAEARAGKDAGAPAACPEPCTIANGTRMPLVLLEGLSAAKDHQGQTFRAVLLEPVRVGAAIAIPQGSILQGVLARRVPPRRLYRPGSLNLLFTYLSLPNGAATAIAASPVAAEVDRGTHMTMDSEGRIHAQNPGKARFLLDFGVTGGISKVSDDTTQLIIEAISATATDASTAGVARFAAMGATTIFLLTRHGRDAILPPYTEMDVSLSRAVSLGSDPPATAPSK
jgi:hypothetical protein